MKLPSFLFRISILKTFTRAIFTTISFILITQHALAQFVENFDDGDFTINPTWTGSTNDFVVNPTNQLQVNAVSASTSFLSAAFSVGNIEDHEWRFSIKQAFAGSANNYSRVYVVSDQEDLTAPLNGYYLQFGEAGSNDAIELFRQTGTTSQSVCRATNGLIAAAFQLRVRLTRDNAGVWKLYADYGNGANFILEASGTDSQHITSDFLGVRCVFTASNASKFFYDDFYAGPLVVDLKPPVLVNVNCHSLSSVDLIFDEAIDPTTALITNNFKVLPDILPSMSALGNDQRTITLQFNPALPNSPNFNYTFQIAGVKDTQGNTIVPVLREFICFDPAPSVLKDLVFTEVLADPQPVVGLPDAEFVEIFNRGSIPVGLDGWTLSDDKSSGKLPQTLLLPGQYLILTSSSYSSSFTGHVAGLTSFPSLNNSGDMIVLKNKQGETIDSIQYSQRWYRDEEKSDGGWSLEIIDPQNICGTSQNWVASEEITGGTPGKTNSVFSENPDLTGPRLMSAVPVSSDRVILTFDDVLSKQLPSPVNFVFSPAVTVTNAAFGDPSLTTIVLNLESALDSETLYAVNVSAIFDCAGNPLVANYSTAIFGLPQNANSHDVVINEILFNPRPTGVDFVELVNASDKFINLKNWTIGNIEGDAITNSSPIATTDVLLAPHEIMLLTENGNRVKGEYVLAQEDRFREIENLPPFNNDAGSVVILDGEGNTIDQFAYSESMHSEFLKSNEGVSLELSNVEVEDAVWESASSLSGYATPGYRNSAAVPDDFSEDVVVVVPEIFEPVTGQPAFATIQFAFNQGNYVSNVKIVDADGRTVRHLSNNDLLGAHGNFIWDGTLDDGTVASMGYYLIWFDVFHFNGSTHTYRKKIAIARRL